MSEKNKKIAYWFFTLWLSLGMVSTAIVQLMKHPEEVEKINQLGYPTYFLILLGVWKLLGVIAVLIPKFILLKEWAYAGFFFAMSGAVISHLVSGHSIGEIFPSLLLLSLTVSSWYLRPANRKF
ncbi:DoxX family protein [Leptospira ognonensis]|uniref:DoxX family protein n=1 Tax=Leptospira ognonensis TaxID=2484945 RepID=A0A4R9JXH1_9LEPT|nr:DoxX family protein [Leptospira ognonensis]TGL56730.1 DoxX family protein [Leptospira ognonensis]